TEIKQVFIARGLINILIVFNCLKVVFFLFLQHKNQFSQNLKDLFQPPELFIQIKKSPECKPGLFSLNYITKVTDK
ncbi:MAG: hypothetical protein K8S16_16225, partial [Bacteroidales bacterium]|nr:hypothetical protein [Bacteroidales bacterium]